MKREILRTQDRRGAGLRIVRDDEEDDLEIFTVMDDGSEHHYDTIEGHDDHAGLVEDLVSEIGRTRAERDAALALLEEVTKRAVTQEDRPALIVAIAVLETSAANDRVQLAHLIAERSDKVVQDVYRRGAERRDEAARMLTRLAVALPPVAGVKP